MKTSYKIFSSAGSRTFYWHGAAHAQEGASHLNINYTIKYARGRFQDFINKTTYPSWAAPLLYGINDQVSVGLGTGFQVFYQSIHGIRISWAVVVVFSAVVSNSVQAIPVLAQVQYNFTSASHCAALCRVLV